MTPIILPIGMIITFLGFIIYFRYFNYNLALEDWEKAVITLIISIAWPVPFVAIIILIIGGIIFSIFYCLFILLTTRDRKEIIPNIKGLFK